MHLVPRVDSRSAGQCSLFLKISLIASERLLIEFSFSFTEDSVNQKLIELAFFKGEYFMLDREPPIFSPSSEGLKAGHGAGEGGRKRSLVSLAFLTLLAITMSFAGLILGFMYGDSFGRKNAQYDNPILRDYYAGKCYDFWETQLKQTLTSTLEEDAVQRRGQSQKLEEIFSKMQDMERALGEYTAGGKTPPFEADKSSVAAAKAATPRKL